MKAEGEFDDLLRDADVHRAAARPTAHSDLDELLAESLEIAGEGRRVAKARKRLAEDNVPTREKEILRALVDEYDEKRVWETVANVALVHAQVCTSCGRESRMFMGWMREQTHREKRLTRRLLAGESPLPIPRRIETHYQKTQPQCPVCLPAYIRMKQAIIPYVMQPNYIKRERE